MISIAYLDAPKDKSCIQRSLKKYRNNILTIKPRRKMPLHATLTNRPRPAIEPMSLRQNENYNFKK
jgi:hypothetical protein